MLKNLPPKGLSALLSFLLLSQAQAFLLFSPFPSQIANETGITIPNARFVGADKRVLRSMRPWSKDPAHPNDMSVDHTFIDQLITAGVTDVLIFKGAEPDRDDILLEKEALVAKGIKEERVRKILFPWKDFTDFKQVCLMTLEALRLLKEIKSDPSRKILFHCTVGEDRTGYLAMLFTLLNDETLRAQPSHVKDIFNEEACRGGYEGGNADKPERVKVSIRSALTPLLTKMTYKIQKGYLSWNSLNDRQCDIDPGQYESYDYDPYFDPATFTCEKSRDFPE